MELFTRFFLAAIIFAVLGTMLGFGPILSTGFVVIILLIFAMVGIFVREVTAFIFLPWTMLWKFLVHNKTYTSQQALNMAQQAMTLVLLSLPVLIGVDYVWFNLAGAKMLFSWWPEIVIAQVAATMLAYPITKHYNETRNVNNYFAGVKDWDVLS